MAVTAPTKGNLMAARRSRTLAENGWELMDKKTEYPDPGADGPH
jgi:vacuolar-type H+-ATPase subunit D/Vma8